MFVNSESKIDVMGTLGTLQVFKVSNSEGTELETFFWKDSKLGEFGPFNYIHDAISHWISMKDMAREIEDVTPIYPIDDLPELPDNIIYVDFINKRRV